MNVVNDWQKSFANTVCRWAVVDEKGREAASGDCALDVPMDAISDSVAIAIPPLEPGRDRLSLNFIPPQETSWARTDTSSTPRKSGLHPRL